MRIAYICMDPGIPVFGQKGASIHVQEVMRALQRRGATVELFTMRLGGEAPADLRQVVVHQLPALPKGLTTAERETAALAANPRLAEALQVANAAGTPFAMIYERYSLWSDGAMGFARHHGIPALLEVNAPLIEEQQQHRGLVDQAAAAAVARRAFGAADQIIAVSDGVADYLNQFAEAAGKVQVIPNGVDIERFSPTTSPHLPFDAAAFTIGFVGSLKAWHGLEVLVEAFALVHDLAPESRLLIVGDGPMRAELEAGLATRHLLAAVHFTGAVNHDEIGRWLTAMDVAVVPYPQLENFYFSPLKLYEYMAAGRAVVASAIGQITNLVDHEQNGLLCAPGDSRALASSLLRLRNDSSLRTRLGNAAHATIRAHHTWDAVAAQLLQLAHLPAPALIAATVPNTQAHPQETAQREEKHKKSTNATTTNAQSLAAALPGLWQLLRRLRPQLAQQKLLIAGALLALLAGIGLRLLEPWPLKIVVDLLSGQRAALPAWLLSWGAEGTLVTAAVGLLSIVALRALAGYFSTVFAALAGNRVLTAVRSELYQHLLGLSLSYHTNARGGDLLTRLIGDVGRLQEVAVTALLPLLVNLLTLVGMLGMMLWLDWRLAVLGVITFPLATLTMQRFSKRIRQAARDQRRRESDMAATASEALGAMRVVKAFSLEGALNELFGSANRKSLKDGVKATRLAASLERTVDLFIGMGTALVLWYGAHLVLRGTLTLGDLIIFLSYLKSAFRPMSDLAKYTGRIAKAVASGERVLDILDTPPAIQDRPDALEAPRFQGEIRFEQVSFAYGEQPLLRNLSFTLAPGQRVAVVGASGVGKSTLASLLLRLYEPNQGQILLDGVDIRCYTQASLRGQMSVVLQESLLFGESVGANIRHGAPDADDEAIEAAARQANAHDFIMTLPAGYATRLGERGATLSGGQRQRIAVARAAVRRAPIVILDEPTVGLDEANAQAVNTALRQLMDGCTALLITHDLKLAATADLILYLEAGQIVERGTHAALVALGGRYATMYGLQTAEEPGLTNRAPDANNEWRAAKSTATDRRVSHEPNSDPAPPHTNGKELTHVSPG